MTTLFTKAADRLLRMIVPAAAASACGLYVGHCYLSRSQCYAGSMCVEWWQCATSQTNYWCEVKTPGGQNYSYGGCC